MHVSLPESDEIQIQDIEQFITTSGNWLIFDSLQSGEMLMPPLDEIYNRTAVCDCG